MSCYAIRNIAKILVKGSMLEFRPHTGRKHQIRVLSASVLGSPIVGDFKYGPGCPKKIRQVVSKPGNLAMTLMLKNVRLRVCCISPTGVGKRFYNARAIQQHYYGPEQHLTLRAQLPGTLSSFLRSTGMLQHIQAKSPVEDGGASSVVVENPQTITPQSTLPRPAFKIPKWKQQYNAA
jgi:hypothetical protein